MNKLIKLEFRKLFSSISYYVCLVVILLMLLLTSFISKVTAEQLNQLNMFNAVKVTRTALDNSMLSLISGIFLAVFISQDESLGTIKNVVSRGYSRIKIYFSKYIVSLISILIYSLIVLIGGFIFGLSVSGVGSIDSGFFISIFGELLVIIGFHALYFMFSTIFNKNGIIITLNIATPLIIKLILGLIDSFLLGKEIKIGFQFGDYWLDGLMSSFNAKTMNAGELSTSIIMTLVYIASFITIGLFVYKKKEVK